MVVLGTVVVVVVVVGGGDGGGTELPPPAADDVDTAGPSPAVGHRSHRLLVFC